MARRTSTRRRLIRAGSPVVHGGAAGSFGPGVDDGTTPGPANAVAASSGSTLTDPTSTDPATSPGTTDTTREGGTTGANVLREGDVLWVQVHTDRAPDTEH